MVKHVFSEGFTCDDFAQFVYDKSSKARPFDYHDAVAEWYATYVSEPENVGCTLYHGCSDEDEAEDEVTAE